MAARQRIKEKSTPTHREILVRAMGEVMVNTMDQLVQYDPEFRSRVDARKEIKTVDGHVWLITLQHKGCEGPDTLSGRGFE